MWISRAQYEDYNRAIDTLQKVEAEYAIVREIFVRLVEQKRTISFDFINDPPDGIIKWDSMRTESGSKEMTVWYEPGEFKKAETEESVNVRER